MEKVVRSHEGRCLLAKLNVDHNQALAAALGVQGIPTVKVFRDGRVVEEFMGALPETEVERILAKVVPSASDEAAEAAAELLQAGQAEEAEKRFREILARDENNAPAAVGLATLLVVGLPQLAHFLLAIGLCLVEQLTARGVGPGPAGRPYRGGHPHRGLG